MVGVAVRPWLLVVCAALSLCLSLLALPVSGQFYTPQPGTASIVCGANQAPLKVGIDDQAAFLRQYPSAYVSSASGSQMQGQLFNVTGYGTTIYQLSIALPDNTALTGPVHIRLYIYAVQGSGFVLLGQASEITYYPSPAMVVYGNLQSPVSLITGTQYMVGMWTDATYPSYLQIAELYSYPALVNSYWYLQWTPFGLPPSYSSSCTGCSGYTYPIAMYGCQDTTDAFLTPTNTVLQFCAALETYNPVPSSSHNYYDPTPSTTNQQWGGIMAVATSPATNSFGSYQTVLAVTGTYTSATVGGSYSQASTTLTTSSSLTLGTSAGASNLVYSAAAPFRVDTGGLALSLSTGGTVVLQYNATTSQLQVVTSTGVQVGALTYFSVQAYVPGSVGSACSTLGLIPTSSVSAAKATCPAGQASIPMGDVSTNDTNAYNPSSTSSLYANVVYTRPMYVPVTGVTVSQLSFFIGRNPGSIIHMRLGIYAASNIQTYYSYEVLGGTLTLLAQTAAITLINTDAGLITANLLTPITLNVSQTTSVAQTSYYVGVIADVPVLAPLTYYFYFPSNGIQYSASSMPTTFTASTYAYGVALIGATGCVASTATTQFAFAASFVYTPATCPSCTPTELQFSGSLTGVALGNGAYYAISGGGAGAQLSTSGISSTYKWGLGGFSILSDQLFYPTSTQPVSLLGLSIAYWTSSQTPNQAVFQWSPASQSAVVELGYDSYQSSQTLYTTILSSLQFAAGTVALQAPTLSLIAPANAITPTGVAGVARAICLLPATFGSLDSSQFSALTPGTALAANMIYSTSITAAAGAAITQVAISVLSNTNGTVALRLGVYDSTGALISTAPEVTIRQVVVQTIFVNLATPFTTTAQTYRVALTFNAPLVIAGGASSTSAFAMAYSTSGLPTTFTPSASGPSLPLGFVGCATPTHTLCGQFQYLVPSAGSSAATLVVYSGLLQAAAVAGQQASLVSFGTGHLMALTNGFAGYYGLTPKFQTISLSRPGYIYSSASAPLDASGLVFNAVATSSAVPQTLLLSMAGGMVVENSTYAQGSVVYNNFTIVPYSAASGIPACSGFNPFAAPTVQKPANPAPVSCPAGSTAITWGSTTPSYDYYYYSEEGEEEVYPYYIFGTQFTTGAASVSIYQLGMGIFQNPNSLAQVGLALYDAKYNLLVNTTYISVLNSVDGAIIGALQTPYRLNASSTYYVAVFTDSYLFIPWTSLGGTKLEVYLGSSSAPWTGQWPSNLQTATSNTQIYTETTGPALQAWGCSSPLPASSAVSSSSSGGQRVITAASTASPMMTSTPMTASTGGSAVCTQPAPCAQCSVSSSSSGSSLSNGAIAGIAIGCAVGGLMLGLFVAYCCLAVAGADRKGQGQKMQNDSEQSTIGGGRTVELSHVRHNGEQMPEA